MHSCDPQTLQTLQRCGVAIPRVLLPAPTVDLARWAVVACDQFTAEPEYWRWVEAIVDDAPSAYRMILPEAFLAEAEGRAPAIHAAMREYMAGGALREAAHGFVLVERAVSAGKRLGLVVALDLEKYDFSPGARSLVRPTEGTIVHRLPPRARIREGAPLEASHVMVLVDDPGRSLTEPLYGRRGSLRPLYDFALMQGGGRLRGWAVEEPEHTAGIAAALDALNAQAGGLLFAVGDGNHSLATARLCWLHLRERLTPEQREEHPARFALVEAVNLHDEALVFEPIHRALFRISPPEVGDAWEAYLRARKPAVEYLPPATGGPCWRVMGAQNALAVAVVQDFLDGFLAAHPGAGIDYIHGEETLRALCRAPDAAGFLLPAMDKAALFPAVRAGGVLPRKTFSIGEAWEKRYYVECRAIG
ncbi:MAG: DUF1015 domain-containing protein [Clostridia bacterium]|nr:DUF1015 domain-containing protein [Clostridia bacterium]